MKKQNSRKRNSTLLILDKFQGASFLGPLKMARKGRITPTLAIEEPKKGLGISAELTNKKGSIHNKTCAFCGEILSVILPGETIVHLTCHDLCHKDCFIAVVNKENPDRLPQCNICKLKTNCVDEELSSTILRDILLETQEPSAKSEPATPIYDSDRTNTQLLTPHGSSNHYNKQNQVEILKPRISVASDKEKLAISDDTNSDLNCLLTVKPPLIYTRALDSEEEMWIRRKVEVEVKEYLTSAVENWSMFFESDYNLGKLVSFDWLDISTNGIDWDRVCCYYFERVIALVKDAKLIGQILTDSDICSINTTDTGIILNLTSEAVPELQIHDQNSVVLAKWESFLTKLVKKTPLTSTPLMQLTCNAWNLINESELPSDIITLAQLINNDADIPSSFLAKILPLPEPVSLNLLVVVPLVNRSNLKNSDFKTRVIQSLDHIRKELRPCDTLGLIFTGIDGKGKHCYSGTFTGCVKSTWDGWDFIINDIRVVSDSFFFNITEELQMGLEKCLELLPFLPQGSKCLNKLMVISSSDFENALPGDEEKLNLLVQKLIYSISITLIRISEKYDDESLRFSHSLSKLKSDDGICLQVGKNIIRFNCFEEFIQNIPTFIKRLQSNCLSEIEIDLSKDLETNDLVEIAEIEINGKMTKLEKCSKLKIIVRDLLPFSAKNVLFKLVLRLGKLEKGAVEEKLATQEEVPILQYESKWLEVFNERQIISKKLVKGENKIKHNTLKKAGSFSPSISEDGKTQDSFFIDIPLYPPLSSPRDQCFARKKTELSIIEILNSVSRCLSNESKELVLSCIAIVFGLLRGAGSICGSPFSHYYLEKPSKEDSPLRLRKMETRIFADNKEYAKFLADELDDISTLFTQDQLLALIRCQDLINSLI